MAFYVDLNKTKFPGQVDERANNALFKANVNFADRTLTTDSNDYYVMADDINALQEAIIAIERSLGVMPQGVDLTNTVGERFNDLEAFTMFTDTGFSNLDERYMWGGLKPSGLAANAKMSIKHHLHDGTEGGSQKISLAQHVTGTLAKTNLDLTSNTANMLVASDIKMSTVEGSPSIADKFADKYNVTGGTINGDVQVKGKMVSRTFAEIDAASTAPGTTGANTADAYADSGNCRRAATANTAGILMKELVNLRYGDYVIGFRMKVAANTSQTPVCKVYAKIDGTEVFQNIRPVDFKTADEYQMIYVEYSHKNRTGGSSRNPIELGVSFYTGVTTLSVDSVVVTPIHTSVYDDSATLSI